MVNRVHPPHVVLFGHYGVGNLGNDSSLEAALHGVRTHLPSATVTCVCRGPRVVAERYGIATLPMDVNEDRGPADPGQARPGLPRKLARRALDEVDFWVRRTRWLRTVDRFIVAGTGAIYDATSPPWNVPYDLFKWCRAAKIAGVKIVFLSVGAGPVVHRASRLLMLNALGIASYRSYRDTASFRYLQSVGFDTTRDRLCPDLVFGLALPDAPPPEVTNGHPLRVGVGVMAYYGPAHDTTGGAPLYRAYVAQMTRFVHWLLDQGHHVRLLTGDVDNDPQPAHEILASVREAGRPEWQARIVSEPIASAHALSLQIAQTDLVIASRFHNLVGALMLGRPVMSVGFHEKNDALMADMGLADYCQHIERIDVDRLIRQFDALRAQLGPVARRIVQKTADYRAALEEQYRCVLSGDLP